MPQAPAKATLGRAVRNVDKYLKRAHEIDPEVAANIRFLPRINDILDDKPADWMTFGDHDLKPIRKCADDHAAIALRISSLDTPGWIDRTREESCKQPGFFKLKNNSPAYFKAMLDRIQPSVQDEYRNITELLEIVRPKSEALRLSAVAVQVVSEDITGQDKVILDGRLRTLINGQQTALMLVQSLEATSTLLLKQTQEIDNLLNAVIPAWTIAYSKA